MKLKFYKEKDILKAIKEEGLRDNAWGYKTPKCIWVYTEAMENKNVWKRFKSNLFGFEKAARNKDCIDTVTYFLLEGYCGNINRLSWEIEHPNEKKLIPDD